MARGEFVRVLDNFTTGKRNNLTPFLDKIEVIEGDLRSYHIVAKSVQNIDYVLHQAALPSVPRSISDPLTSNDVNVTGSLNLLHAALEARVKRVVYASSSSVYGDSPISPKHEGLVPQPKSPYAVGKHALEQYARVFYQLYGLETVGLRYFNVFGPRQDPTSQYSAVIPKFLAAMQEGKQPTVHGDGMQSRDFTYVANNVSANLAACEVPNVAGEVYNIACGENFTLLDLIAEINGILGTSLEPKFTDSRPGDIKHSKADITHAISDLDYKPTVGFREGLALLVAHAQAPIRA